MEKTMMLYTAATNGEKTFSLLPLSADCPFNEAIYMPKLEALAILGKTTRDTFTMLERLDENGNPTGQTGKGSEPEKPKMQRVQLSTPWEYFVHEKDEIRAFIKANAINEETFNYTVFMTELEVPKIITTG